MKTHLDKKQDNSQRTSDTQLQRNNSQPTFQFVDNRPEAIAQRKLQESANNSPQAQEQQAIQRMANNYAAQQFTLKSIPVQEATGETIQRAVSKSMLDDQLAEDATYHGTIDSDTPYKTALSVGEEWVGGGATEKKYGPPFGFQKVSADGTKQFRPPMVKKQSKMSGQAQANYEARSGSSGGFGFNAHATIPDIGDYDPSADKDTDSESNDNH